MMSPVWQKHEATIRWNLHPCTGGRVVESARKAPGGLELDLSHLVVQGLALLTNAPLTSAEAAEVLHCARCDVTKEIELEPASGRSIDRDVHKGPRCGGDALQATPPLGR